MLGGQLRTYQFLRKHSICSTTFGTITATWAFANIREWHSEKQLEQYQAKLTNCNVTNNKSVVFPFASSKPGIPPTLPRSYDRNSIENYWACRPSSVIRRISEIMTEIAPLIYRYVLDFHLRTPLQHGDILQQSHARDLKDALTRLGPAFVKMGQQLSIRPDLVPGPVLVELQKLCDSVQPVEDSIAMEMLCNELGIEEASVIFDDIHLVASASLGQVYKAKLKDEDAHVAIKVQRPDMVSKVSLDLFLLHKISFVWDSFTQTFTEQAPYHSQLVNTFAHGSYMELDYENEAKNQVEFKTQLYQRKCKVYIPDVYSQYTTRKVLTTEWIDGIKLSDAPMHQIRDLIPVGVQLFLTQLLDIGSFHADPHPGNLYVHKDTGMLCLLDFGLCAKVDEDARIAMTSAIVNLLTGNFDRLVSHDAKNLGFLPHDFDTEDIKPLLTKILSEGLLQSKSDFHSRKMKFSEISNELNEVFFRYPFSVPPFFALITRGLGLLEGIALSADPEFDIFKASFPYARRRAIDLFGVRGLEKIRRQQTRIF